MLADVDDGCAAMCLSQKMQTANHCPQDFRPTDDSAEEMQSCVEVCSWGDIDDVSESHLGESRNTNDSDESHLGESRNTNDLSNDSDESHLGESRNTNDRSNDSDESHLIESQIPSDRSHDSTESHVIHVHPSNFRNSVPYGTVHSHSVCETGHHSRDKKKEKKKDYLSAHSCLPPRENNSSLSIADPSGSANRPSVTGEELPAHRSLVLVSKIDFARVNDADMLD